MKVLMLWKYYPQYFSYFYKKYPYVADLSFKEHRNRIFDDHFAWPAELSKYMNQQGIEAEFIIANAESLQKKWAEENKFSSYSAESWEKEIVLEQIRRFKPDILWITSIFDYYGKFVKEALVYAKKAITWVGSPFMEEIDASGFSVLLTENPNTFQSIQSQFKKVIVTKPGFNPKILGKIGLKEKIYDVTFIGGITPIHTKRAKILAYLIKNGVNLKVFGYLYEQSLLKKSDGLRRVARHILKHQSFHEGLYILKRTFVKTEYQYNAEIIKSVNQGPVFGLDMYRILAASRIALNIHIDVAGNNAGNMRMFEATGIGTCLLTEHANNIYELFEPGVEILTYKSKEELLGIIQKVLNKDKRVEQIAQAGQKRTLQSHTIGRTFNDIKPAFSV